MRCAAQCAQRARALVHTRKHVQTCRVHLRCTYQEIAAHVRDQGSATNALGALTRGAACACCKRYDSPCSPGPCRCAQHSWDMQGRRCAADARHCGGRLRARSALARLVTVPLRCPPAPGRARSAAAAPFAALCWPFAVHSAPSAAANSAAEASQFTPTGARSQALAERGLPIGMRQQHRAGCNNDAAAGMHARSRNRGRLHLQAHSQTYPCSGCKISVRVGLVQRYISTIYPNPALACLVRKVEPTLRAALGAVAVFRAAAQALLAVRGAAQLERRGGRLVARQRHIQQPIRQQLQRPRHDKAHLRAAARRLACRQTPFLWRDAATDTSLARQRLCDAEPEQQLVAALAARLSLPRGRAAPCTANSTTAAAGPAWPAWAVPWLSGGQLQHLHCILSRARLLPGCCSGAGAGSQWALQRKPGRDGRPSPGGVPLLARTALAGQASRGRTSSPLPSARAFRMLRAGSRAAAAPPASQASTYPNLPPARGGLAVPRCVRSA